MKKLVLILLTFLFSVNSFAQTKNELQKLVETEMAFAKMAEEKGIKNAFPEFLDDKRIIFVTPETNEKLFSQNNSESPSRLLWKLSRADVSSDGNLGYTTGGWELGQTGKINNSTIFGQYATVWQKRDEVYKIVLEVGVPFDKSAIKPVWDSPKDAGTGEKSPKKKIDLGTLTDIFSKKQLSSGYFNYLADDVIVLRENYQPFYGKKQAFVELEKLDKEFPPDGFLTFNGNISPNYGNMIYAWGVYSLKLKDNSVKKWNFMQIWKFRENRWQIVLDVFSPVKMKI